MPPDPIRRLPPVPPSSSKDTSKADGKKFREELQKVEKILEVDPDEQSRKKQREEAIEPNKKGPLASSEKTLLPSPFDVNFHQEVQEKGIKKSLSSPKEKPLPTPSPQSRSTQSSQVIPSPSYSPAPTVQATPESSSTPTTSSPLPSSPSFWQDADVSSNSSDSSQSSFIEYRSQPQPRSETSPSKNDNDDDNQEDEGPYVYQPEAEHIERPSHKVKEKKEQESKPFSIGSSQEEEEEEKMGKETSLGKQETSFDEKSLKTKLSNQASEPNLFEAINIKNPSKTAKPIEDANGAAPSSQTLLPGQEKPSSPLPAMPTGSSLASNPQKSEEKAAPVQSVGEKFGPLSSIGDATSDGKEEKREGEKKELAPGQTSVPAQFAPTIQPLIQAATAQAASYLSDETMALFQQMVGTIYVVNARPGISTTEVTLNSQAFEGSKFFGSTITIEKYATAPSSLNIRLSGPTEAVNAFNQNLSSLVAAFEQNKFAFSVRLETAYQVNKADKPVFQRKGKKDSEKDSKDRR